MLYSQITTDKRRTRREIVADSFPRHAWHTPVTARLLHEGGVSVGCSCGDFLILDRAKIHPCELGLLLLATPTEVPSCSGIGG